MKKRNFVGSSEDIPMVMVHESWGRKNDSNAVKVETTEDQMIPGMFDSKHFVPIEEVPESIEDIEESLIEAIDAGEIAPETFESMGNPQRLQCPKHFKIVKYLRGAKNGFSHAVVASVNARVGVIALSF